MPDEFVEIVPVLVIASLAIFRGEIILVPPLVLNLWRQRDLAGCLATDQITAHRDDSLAALWPEHGDVIRCPRSPIKSGDYRLVDFERIHQMDNVESNDGGLAVPNRVVGEESRRARAAKVGHDHVVA